LHRFEDIVTKAENRRLFSYPTLS